MGGHFDLESSKKELAALATEIEDPTLWDNPKNAETILKKHRQLETAIQEFEQADSGFDELIEMLELAEAEGDTALINETTIAMEASAAHIRQLEITCLFSEEVDQNDCYIEIHAGAGGTESYDWANMLLRMYLRWAERHDFKAKLIHETAGEEAGIKSATIQVEGFQAYGWSKTESGVHRLVRISPFNAAGKRHTSFASVWVYPVIDDNIDIDIQEKDLRIDTYRASGAGGQHVNTTDSAVRITHTPTGIVVQCQNDRSQHKNKAQAMNMLRARLFELEMQKKQEETSASHDAKTDIGWGHQIRSYVLHPYQMVKDLRTNIETSDTKGVLDGDLDRFIQGSLEALVLKK